jgi:uncharacterized membrane protein
MRYATCPAGRGTWLTGFALQEEPVNDILTSFVSFAVPIIEACGAVIISLEVLRTLARYLIAFFGRRPIHMPELRTRLGQSMVMGLEFQVAADILRTALAPTWNDILLLAALIALRTVLNYLLEHELQVIRARAVPSPGGGPEPRQD